MYAPCAHRVRYSLLVPPPVSLGCVLGFLLHLLHRILPMLRALLGARCHIRVVFHCEGVTPRTPTMIPDYTGKHTNFAPVLDAFNATAAVGSSDAVRAFHEMCHSDVLVGGLSGMSHVVAVLCSTPAVLALPWCRCMPPNCMPNYFTAGVQRVQIPWGKRKANVTRHIVFNETAFQNLLEARVVQQRELRCCPFD